MKKSIRGINKNRKRAISMYENMWIDYVWTKLVEDTIEAKKGFCKLRKKFRSVIKIGGSK